ncbi:hypothetical protein CONPUDRAFT_155672 [Coniophora puteana RWD-64-598 SS2]|uniref:Uncharacterized protein n=1 Tax=Coniophora puteana (strain RWD-64-598) TaxID=741705 RepID=A0A5M3MJL1_CONPW|nr:uncharacterized protein CONPUDRAFT_155672 [Coniophora puteana RWD-64-598 SS2]EIW78984.1 hypothetical protein CONPUDRAFT_155672 [Coniophora puteana RWD-64-598 SS2]
MTENDLKVLDTVESLEYMSGELSDEELDIPAHMIPPNPDDSDILPSQVHPSYPYGNPTSIKHPAARPRPTYDPTSRALFEDMGYAGGGINGALRWRDLALEQLLPADDAKEETRKAAEARRMANGTTGGQGPGPQSAAAVAVGGAAVGAGAVGAGAQAGAQQGQGRGVDTTDAGDTEEEESDEEDEDEEEGSDEGDDYDDEDDV